MKELAQRTDSSLCMSGALTSDTTMNSEQCVNLSMILSSKIFGSKQFSCETTWCKLHAVTSTTISNMLIQSSSYWYRHLHQIEPMQLDRFKIVQKPGKIFPAMRRKHVYCGEKDKTNVSKWSCKPE